MADADASSFRSGRHAALDTEHATDDTETFPAITDDEPAAAASVGRVGRNILDRLPGLGRAFVERIPALVAAVGAGLLLCVSFPPFGWWYCAIIAFAVLTWVLLRESTTPA